MAPEQVEQNMKAVTVYGKVCNRPDAAWMKVAAAWLAACVEFHKAVQRYMSLGGTVDERLKRDGNRGPLTVGSRRQWLA